MKKEKEKQKQKTQNRILVMRDALNVVRLLFFFFWYLDEVVNFILLNKNMNRESLILFEIANY